MHIYIDLCIVNMKFCKNIIGLLTGGNYVSTETQE